MIRRLGMFAVLAFVATTSSAEAGIFGFFERLSGPGPFIVLGAPVPFGCFGASQTEVEKILPDVRAQFSQLPNASSDEFNSYINEQATKLVKPRWRRSWNCRSASPQGTNLILGADVLFMWTRDNDLVAADSRRIHAFSVIPYLDVHLNESLEIGAGLGFMRFTSPDETFDPFSKAALQPLRVTYRFLAPFHKSPLAELPMLRIAATALPRLNGSDFGGNDADFKDSGEISWSASLMLDLSRLKR
jgi:hypothetical protein